MHDAAAKSTQDRTTGTPRRSGLFAASFAAALVACCALLAAPAQADPPNNNGQQGQQGQQGQRRDNNRRDFRDSRWGDARDPRSFESRAEDQRRLMEENSNNAEMNRRVGRMTADERRDLRRQINEAGQEVYALPPKR